MPEAVHDGLVGGGGAALVAGQAGGRLYRLPLQGRGAVHCAALHDGALEQLPAVG